MIAVYFSKIFIILWGTWTPTISTVVTYLSFACVIVRKNFVQKSLTLTVCHCQVGGPRLKSALKRLTGCCDVVFVVFLSPLSLMLGLYLKLHKHFLPYHFQFLAIMQCCLFWAIDSIVTITALCCRVTYTLKFWCWLNVAKSSWTVTCIGVQWNADSLRHKEELQNMQVLFHTDVADCSRRLNYMFQGSSAQETSKSYVYIVYMFSKIWRFQGQEIDKHPKNSVMWNTAAIL